MGTIAGYYIPMWCGMIVNPHSRVRIDTIMTNNFPGGLENTLMNETLLISYDYQQQVPYFYSKWFAYKSRFSGDKGKAQMTVGQAVAASSARPDVFSAKK